MGLNMHINNYGTSWENHVVKLQSFILSNFHIPKSCHGFDMFIENWLGSLDFISSLAPQIPRKPTLHHKKTRGLAAPLNGRCWQEIRCSIISSLRTLDVGIEKSWTFDVILAGIFAAILKRNHAITDHFQIIRTIHPINEIGGPSNQI